MADDIRDFAADGLLNLAGGCCGSTPPHIRAVTNMVAKYAPRLRTPRPDVMYLAGLEMVRVYA